MKLRAVVALLFTALFLAPVGAATAADLHEPHEATSVSCDGQVLWHFVHNQVSTSTDTLGTITAEFAGDVTLTEDANKKLRTVRQYDVITESGTTLLDAFDDITEGNLVLSHTECLGGGTTEECVAGETMTITWGDVELGRPNVGDLVETASTSVTLLPGEYEVTLTSTDVMHRAGFQAGQTREQWYVELWADGVKVAETAVIADLPTAETTMTQAVGTVSLTSEVDTAVATHLLAGDALDTWGAPHSVEPTSAVFVCL